MQFSDEKSGANKAESKSKETKDKDGKEPKHESLDDEEDNGAYVLCVALF